MLLALVGCGADEPTDPPSRPPAPEPPLAIGLSEANPHLVSPQGAPAFAAAREQVAALRPRYLRLVVHWSRIQPTAGEPPDFGVAQDGCLRGRPPCAPWGGLREQLAAITARQRADGGWRLLVVPHGTPDWAAAPATGCERPGTGPSGRMPDPEAYRAFMRAVQGLAREVGVRLAYWSPWNEPNHPTFLNPQRRRCDPHAAPTAPALYARLARVAAQELGPGQQLVLGELAGYDEPQPTAATAEEFARALPRDVICRPGPWGQHTFVGERGRRGEEPETADPRTAANIALVDAIDRVLRRRGCPKPIWITETGSFDHGCEAIAAALADWARDPRVDAAFQYTFREDPQFPEGLADTGLSETYPAYEAWRAAAAPGGPPARPCA